MAKSGEEGKTNKPRRLLPLLGWLAAAGALLAVYGGLAAGSVTRYFVYNADALYLPALLRDLFSGGHLGAWQLPPAPYFFPDLLLYAPLQAVLGDFRLAVLAYGVVQWGLFLLAWFLLVKVAAHGGRTTLAGLAPLFGSVMLLLLASGRYDLFMPAILSAHHFGGLLAALGLLAGLAAWLRGGIKTGWIAAIGAAAALVIFSDALFILMFAVPALLALAIDAWARRRLGGRSVLAAVVILLSIPLGLGLYRLAIPNPVLGAYLGLDPANLGRGLSLFGQWLAVQWPGHAALLVLWVAGMAVGIWALVREWSGRSASPEPASDLGPESTPPLTPPLKGRGIILAFLLISPIVTLGGLVLSGNVVERQYLGALILPAFVIWPVVLAQLSEKWNRRDILTRWAPLGAGVVCVLLALPGMLNLGRLGELTRLYPPEAACLDNLAAQHGWKAGLGDYWQARTFTLFSQRSLQVVQVQSDLSIFHWISSIDWYWRGFQFVVIDETPGWNGRLNEQLIRQQFGDPYSTTMCGVSKVLAYDRSRDTQFQQQFLGSPAFAHIQKPGDSFTFYAAQMESFSGDRLGWGRIGRSGSAPADMLVNGPPISLPAGSYTLSIHYVNTPGATSEDQDVWYVQAAQGSTFADITSGNLPANAHDVRGEFTLKSAGQVVIQTYYAGTGTLEVDTVEVTRVR